MLNTQEEKSRVYETPEMEVMEVISGSVICASADGPIDDWMTDDTPIQF